MREVPHEFTSLVADFDGVDPDTGIDRPWLVGGDLAVLAGDARQLKRSGTATRLRVFFETQRTPARYVETALTPWGLCQLGFGERGLLSLSLLAATPDAQAAPVTPSTSWHPLFRGAHKELTLQLQGTSFEHAVWRVLLSLRRGQTTTYGAIARQIGQPGAARAVGGAVGRNPLAWIVPCHRVLPANGQLGGFRWGAALKSRMLQAESWG